MRAFGRQPKRTARGNLYRGLALAVTAVVGLTTTASHAAEPPPGATSCTGCHATGRTETAVPPIVGRNADELRATLHAFRSGERPATVMNRIAKGFSDTELDAIAVWFANVR